MVSPVALCDGDVAALARHLTTMIWGGLQAVRAGGGRGIERHLSRMLKNNISATTKKPRGDSVAILSGQLFTSGRMIYLLGGPSRTAVYLC